jgi:threonine/homoserine/homoserine lactone efflux protein
VFQNKLFLALMLGVGAASADTLLSAIALLSLDFWGEFLRRTEVLVRLLAGIVLLVVGMFLWLRPKPPTVKRTNPAHPLKSFFIGFALTFFNPIALTALAALFSAFHLQSADWRNIWIIVLGVCAGCFSWWGALNFSFYWMRRKIALSESRIINQVAGAILFALGIYSLLSTYFVLWPSDISLAGLNPL